MRALEELKSTLMEELEEIARKPEMGAGDLEIVHKLTDTIKNIDKICMLEDGEEYDDDYSYARHRDSRGRYSRDGGRPGHPYYMPRYSRDGGRDMLVGKLEEMMDDASTDKEREAIRRCISQIKNA